MNETGYASDAAGGDLALQLREFRPLQGTNRLGRRAPLRVLHLLSQQPGASAKIMPRAALSIFAA